jgi:hypothetical protein
LWDKHDTFIIYSNNSHDCSLSMFRLTFIYVIFFLHLVITHLPLGKYF